MSLLLTKAGLAAYAQADVSGTKLQATHIAIGDGDGTSVSHTSQSAALVNETWRGELQKIEVAASGEVEFEGHVPITVGGWYIRELAIYAGEILLAVGSHPEVWKPDPESPDKVELVITAPVKFANAAVINLTVDTTKVLASQEHVASKIAEHDADQDAHAAVFASLAEYTGFHAKRRDNPHEVTATQVGAYTKAQIDALLGEGWTQSIGNTGWARLPNGMIIQWGVVAKSVTSTNAFILSATFPVAFPTSVLFATATLNQLTTQYIYPLAGITSNQLSTTGFTARFGDRDGNSYSFSMKIYWFAIGY